jgi:hypothetical protein
MALGWVRTQTGLDVSARQRYVDMDGVDCCDGALPVCMIIQTTYELVRTLVERPGVHLTCKWQEGTRSYLTFTYLHLCAGDLKV